MDDELKKIKKLYGEKMMHLSRTLFPTVLNKKGLLLSILENTIAPTHSFVDDIIENELEDEFKNFILEFVPHEINVTESIESPFDLIKKAGYTLYECKSEEDIQSFRKYYRKDELICTIQRGNRLKRCFVFFAVKDDVDKIKRENFPNPKRDDLYGTSVISIQFARGSLNNVSIMNRYNHTIKDQNPDCTFNNNLERIIPGLTKSFEKYYGFNILKTIAVPYFLSTFMNYIKADDGKYYRFNFEYDNVYYCENNYIVDHGILYDNYAKNKERYILMDFYVLDLKEKRIFLHDKYIEDSFIDSINDLGNINKIDIKKDGENRVINIILDKGTCQIKLDRKNKIISYVNNDIQEIRDKFMYNVDGIEEIEMNNVLNIDDNFLPYCADIKKIELQSVKEINNNFLKSAYSINSINLPNVLRIGDNFLSGNTILEEINALKLEEVGFRFLAGNDKLQSINFPNLLFIDDDFLKNNKSLVNANIPKIVYIGKNALIDNTNINVYDFISQKKR